MSEPTSKPTENKESKESKYLYCILRLPEAQAHTPPLFSSRGIGGRGDVIHTIRVGNLAAVVSDSPVMEYDQSRRNMLAHTQAQEEAMQHGPILPVRFGIIASSAAAIERKLLQQRAAELHGLLDGLEGRQEASIKAFWFEGIIFEEILKEHDDIRELRDSLMHKPPEGTYYERIRLGEMIEAAVQRKREADAERILNRLRPLAEQHRINQILTERMVVNVAFLIRHERKADLDAAIDDLDAAMGERMLFKYISAAPPYNFVSLKISWDD